ncbi:LOW QUALITY PROTEIN: uncharacterized protein J5M81_009435 [Pluvialis apricaria]
MAPHQPSAGQYLRSDSGGSETPMLPDGPDPAPAPAPGGARGEARRRRRRCGPLWGSVAVMAILALQIASTTGLFVYFTMAIAKLKAQVAGERGRSCGVLQVLNQQQEGLQPEELISNQSLPSSWPNTIQSLRGPRRVPPRASRSPSVTPSFSPGNSKRFGNLSLCRHAIARWRNSTIHSHLQNITYRDGRLQVNQQGKYYVYSQIYFRYPSDRAGARVSVPQLVQCINWKTSYSNPFLLLKGVGTKCWAPEADYGLHALYQGGLFELKAGDELFVSVSSLAIDYNDAAASYFGAFRLDPVTAASSSPPSPPAPGAAALRTGQQPNGRGMAGAGSFPACVVPCGEGTSQRRARGVAARGEPPCSVLCRPAGRKPPQAGRRTRGGGHPGPGGTSPPRLPSEQTERVTPDGSLLQERHRGSRR